MSRRRARAREYIYNYAGFYIGRADTRGYFIHNEASATEEGRKLSSSSLIPARYSNPM